jgi:hypothetical protein
MTDTVKDRAGLRGDRAGLRENYTGFGSEVKVG